MRERRPASHWVLVLSAVVAVAACAGASRAAPIPGEPFVVASGPRDSVLPDAGGSIIIWNELARLGGPVPGETNDVLGYNVDTGQPFVVGAGPGFEYPGSTDGRSVAWGDLGADGFFVRPVAGGPARHFPLALSPRVAGDFVAYIGGTTSETARLELASLSGGPVPQLPDRRAVNASHDLSDRYLVWEDVPDPNDASRRTIQALDLRDGRTIAVSSGERMATDPAVSDRWAVWMEQGGVWARDLQGGGAPFRVSSPTATASLPDVSGSIAVWGEVQPGRTDGDVYGMDLLTGARFPIAADVGLAQGTPTISGRLVAWAQQAPAGDIDIYAVIIPEPGAGCGCLLAGAALLRRRRHAQGGRF
jgi:hypothetical protein